MVVAKLSFCVLILVVATGSANAGFVTLVAVADGDIRRIGTGGAVNPYQYSSDTTSEYVQTTFSHWPERGIFEFDLSSVQSMANSITAARLDLTLHSSVVRTTDTFIQVNMRGYEGNGSVEIADFEVSTTFLGSQTIYATDSGGPASGATVSFDLDVDYLKQLASAGSFIGIRSSQQFNFSGFTVRSLEYSGSSQKPTLVLISAVPEPSSAYLCMCAIGLTFLQRKRRCRA